MCVEKSGAAVTGRRVHQDWMGLSPPAPKLLVVRTLQRVLTLSAHGFDMRPRDMPARPALTQGTLKVPWNDSKHALITLFSQQKGAVSARISGYACLLVLGVSVLPCGPGVFGLLESAALLSVRFLSGRYPVVAITFITAGFSSGGTCKNITLLVATPRRIVHDCCLRVRLYLSRM